MISFWRRFWSWENYKAYVAWEWEVFDHMCLEAKRWWDARSTWRR